MLVSYSCDTETLVCDIKDEKKLLKIYFKEGGRNVEEYDRLETNGVVSIEARNKTSVDSLK
jgi:hypothetical protein